MRPQRREDRRPGVWSFGEKPRPGMKAKMNAALTGIMGGTGALVAVDGLPSWLRTAGGVVSLIAALVLLAFNWSTLERWMPWRKRAG